MKSFKNPHLLLALSMAIFGTLAPFVRNISVSSGELALYRAILASGLIGIFLLITRQSLHLREIGRDLPLLLISGMAMGINWILLFEAYQYTTVSAATLSYYFAPVLVVIISPLLFRERMTAKQIVCFCMSTAGLVLVIGIGDIAKNDTHWIGILFGLGAACFYATVMILNKFIKNVAGVPRTFLQFISAILILIPYVACTGGVTLGEMNSTGWICLFVVGLVHTGITYCLYFSSIKDLPGQQVAILSYIDPLVAIVVSVVILHESMTVWQVLGGAMILGFTLWNELGNKKSKK